MGETAAATVLELSFATGWRDVGGKVLLEGTQLTTANISVVADLNDGTNCNVAVMLMITSVY